jgi:anti-repressor protein
MSNIQIFNNPDFGTVRTLDNDGTVLFCGADIAKALGYSNPSKALNDHCKGDLTKRYPITDSLGRTQDAIFIPESDLYRLVFGSKLPSAEKFTDWVTETVLPSIRKHGAYMTPETLQAAILNPDTMIQLCQQLKTEQDKNKALSEENAKLAPKGLFADAVSVSDRCILVSELAKLLKQNGIETGQNRLYEQLRADGFLVKDRKRSDFNMPTQKAMELGLFKVRESTRVHSDGHTTIDKTTKVTGKGQIYLINYYLKKQ